MATETPEAPTQTAPPSSNRFFTWMRAIGITRQPGWVGGVSVGIADRIGIDPLIVRGIIVVIAVLGGPAILLYAAAWLLLPDRFGKIHLEQLLRGTVESPIAAIAGLVVLSLLPVTQGFWSVGAAFWSGGGVGASAGRVLWTIVLIGVLIAVTVWLARRAHAVRTDATAPAPTEPLAPPTPAPTVAAEQIAPTIVSDQPARPAAGAPTEEFDAWRAQQAAWKAERAAFAAQQAATAREASAALSRERREAREAQAAEEAEKRRSWRLANPRIPAALVAVTVGVAILAGGIAALLASTLPNGRGGELTVGLGTATVVLGVCLVAAGAFGRRNGFVVFLSIVLLLATVATSFIPRDRETVAASFSTAEPGRYTQLLGSMTIGGESAAAAQWQPGDTMDVWQAAGSIALIVPAGRTVRLIAETRGGNVVTDTLMPAGFVPGDNDTGYTSDDGFTRQQWLAPHFDGAGERTFDETFGDGTTPDLTVHVWQGAGSISVRDDTQRNEAQSNEGDK